MKIWCFKQKVNNPARNLHISAPLVGMKRKQEPVSLYKLMVVTLVEFDNIQNKLKQQLFSKFMFQIHAIFSHSFGNIIVGNSVEAWTSTSAPFDSDQ